MGARKRALSFDGGDKQESTPKRRRGGRHTPEVSGCTIPDVNDMSNIKYVESYANNSLTADYGLLKNC